MDEEEAKKVRTEASARRSLALTISFPRCSQIKKMGGLTDLLSMIPGVGSQLKKCGYR